MLNGFRTQSIREAEVGPETAAELAATSHKRDLAREALDTLAELADAIRSGDTVTIDRIQARLRASSDRPRRDSFTPTEYRPYEPPAFQVRDEELEAFLAEEERIEKANRTGQ